MRQILVATDFSERSDRALRRAKLIARQTGAGITLVHVVDDDQPHGIVEVERVESERLLHQMSATLREVDGVDCDARVILASPFAGIARAVDDMAPDLVVIGPHRRQVLKDVFIGTTAERTIRSVDRPVLMVNAPPAGQYGRIMQTTDLSTASRDALRRFSSLPIGGNAVETLLHIFDAPALRLAMSATMPEDDRDRYLAEEQNDALRNLSEFIDKARLDRVEPHVRFMASAIEQEILRAARDEKADLIVLSTHGRTGLRKLLLGSVTERLLRTATIDVLAIPPKRGA